MAKLETWVKAATEGDQQALEKVVLAIQDMVYNLALRMLWHPEEARDATQEILIRVVTNLGRFEQKSAFKTWVYRVASNYLLNYRKQQFRRLSFEEFGAGLREEAIAEEGAWASGTHSTELSLLVLEAKVGCSQAMLQCLDRKGRLVYILGEILEFNSQEGGQILDIRPDAFRQSLSRARKKLHGFMQSHCGLIHAANACRCRKRVQVNIDRGVIDPDHLMFVDASHEDLIQSIDQLQAEVAVFQSNPDYQAPAQLLPAISKAISLSGL